MPEVREPGVPVDEFRHARGGWRRLGSLRGPASVAVVLAAAGIASVIIRAEDRLPEFFTLFWVFAGDRLLYLFGVAVEIVCRKLSC